MRKLIVGNLVTLDGYYEGKDRNLNAIFDYFHPDYADDQNFDYYMAERMRAADTLLLSGRTNFLDNMSYWTGVPDDPNATAIRREMAARQDRMEKVVVSDRITREELAPWDQNTRIVKVANVVEEITALKQEAWSRDLYVRGAGALESSAGARPGRRTPPHDFSIGRR